MCEAMHGGVALISPPVKRPLVSALVELYRMRMNALHLHHNRPKIQNL